MSPVGVIASAAEGKGTEGVPCDIPHGQNAMRAEQDAMRGRPYNFWRSNPRGWCDICCQRRGRKRKRWLTAEEEARLLAASPVWLQEIIVFAVNTGLRQSEILNLQWCNVDLFRKTITLLEQKNGGRDTLPVNARTLDVLKARAKVRSLKTDYVFFNGAENRMDARDLLRAFYPAMRKADVKRFRFHDLRHTFATRLVQAGADIYTVQKLGRWKTISMVMRYGHHHSESLRAGIEILDRITAGISTVLAQSADSAVTDAGRESLTSY